MFAQFVRRYTNFTHAQAEDSRAGIPLETASALKQPSVQRVIHPAPQVTPPNETHHPEVLAKNLSLMLWDVMFFSIMIGLGEQYLSAYAVALNFSVSVSGWITTVPLLSGAALQLITPWAVRRLGSHRTWTMGCVAVQGLSFIPLMISSIVGGLPEWALFVIASLYWGAGLAAGPAWNAWVTGIIPVEQRSPFLAKRTRIGQLSLLVAFVIGGIALEFGKQQGYELAVFTGLFAAAGICRLISAMCLYRKSEPRMIRTQLQELDSQAVRQVWHQDGAGALLAYLWVMYAMAQISGPFFVPYILKDLNCEYLVFMMIVSISILAKALVMPFAGRFAQQYGARKLLIYSGLVIVPLSGMWMISREIPYILGLQFAAGLSWGAFELGIVLIFLDSIPVARRTSVLTIYNLGYAVSSVFGSLAGGFLLRYMDNSTEGYYWVFMLSSVGRLLTLPLAMNLPGRYDPTAHQTINGESANELSEVTNDTDTSVVELARDQELIKVHD